LYKDGDAARKKFLPASNLLGAAVAKAVSNLTLLAQDYPFAR